ncbi:hypothetical protein K432DRAFT_405744 [Lepidopterella palustris CBS 459.81]|uniref:Uncharacterized protein n=1 Tax=Lepidopterella palustris CBS 459.81 TaxID=1314670 RepID=A0A8E2E8E5_9PEZI|nr:hypothetical protein K432DRAFT_405744 [Lepidopterella palustris CBS 459.81]
MSPVPLIIVPALYLVITSVYYASLSDAHPFSSSVSSAIQAWPYIRALSTDWPTPSSIGIALPTPLPCSDPSWTPSPETWAAEDVDKLLANTRGNWGSGTSFVDYIAKYTGLINQQCGIGVIGTCVVPDCNAFQNAGGEKWVYFTAVSIVEMNTMLNLINAGINTGTTDLSLLLGQITNDFFPPQPQPTKKNIWPWIEAALTSLLAFIPLIGKDKYINVRSAVGQSAAAFAVGGLSELSPKSSDPVAYYLGTEQKLGTTFENFFNNATLTLEKWSQTLFNGEADASGKTIIDYFAGGRFAISYNVTESEIEDYYFQTMVSNVVNDQWKSSNLPTRQFVMCTNGTASCNETSLYAEGGRTCCLYSLEKNGNYSTPPGLNNLESSTFGINASSITASSLHSYLAQGLNYNASDISTRIQASLQGNSTTQAFAEGVGFQGIWTLPVCDVGDKGFWVANYNLKELPCCCGADCAETNKFINEAQLENFGDFYKNCKQQYQEFVSPPAPARGRSVRIAIAIVFSVIIIFATVADWEIGRIRELAKKPLLKEP